VNKIEKIEHEIMLPLIDALEKAIEDLRKLVKSNQALADEQKPAKKLVDWSCPLLKGCNTNFGELVELYPHPAWFSSHGRCLSLTLLRLVPPATPTSNWQVYHQGETNLQTLHDAGFVVDVKYVSKDSGLFSAIWRPSVRYGLIAHYRVIGIREGFTDVPESAT
jgi:hypothetical protein